MSLISRMIFLEVCQLHLKIEQRLDSFFPSKLQILVLTWVYCYKLTKFRMSIFKKTIFGEEVYILICSVFKCPCKTQHFLKLQSSSLKWLLWASEDSVLTVLNYKNSCHVIYNFNF